MFRDLRFFFPRLLTVTVLLAGILVAPFMAGATVETYVDDATPSASGVATGQPLSPGDLTMQDLLKTYAPPKKTPPAASANASPTVLTPQLKPATEESSESSMLLEGMQSALRQSGVNTSTPLQAPRLPSDRAASAAAAPAPAQAATPPQTLSADSTLQMQPAAGAAPTPAAATASTGGPCVPTVTNWTKTCAEAGYPAIYVGHIRGETRTSCPDGTLKDVWIANACNPPDETGAPNAPQEEAPLTAPTPPSSTSEIQAPDATPQTSSAVLAPNTYLGTAKLDAGCGSANGLAAVAQPLYDLCATGKPTTVTGNGPWLWSCQGANGGMTVSCAASLAQVPVPAAAASRQSAAPALEDAQCGTSDGVVADSAPGTGLCSKGLASHVNGNGPWTWACSGLNGGRPAACSAPKKIDGICGASDGTGTDQMPMSDLCTAGYASAVTGSGPWAWTCSGLNGGQAATCSASPKLNAVCGPASLTGSREAPRNALCSVGQATDVKGSGPWNWSCTGTNGGSSVSCNSPLSVAGICGSAHGMTVPDMPSDNLCSSGKASRVSGNGPWNWICSGSDGGDTASCTALRLPDHAPVPVPPVAKSAPVSASVGNVAPASAAMADTSDLCGGAAEAVAIEAPSNNLCKSGTASSVSGKGPWSWTCSDSGHQSSCATLSLTGANTTPLAAPAVAPMATPAADSPATCGSASGQGVMTQPTTDLCSVGKASAVRGKGPWDWTCTKGKGRAACEAQKIADGLCGSSNGSVQKYAPTSGLCNAGTATQIQGTGPWIWSCVGTGGGASISCSAAAQSQTRVDGSCGVSASASLSSKPTSNLCESGIASSVYGEGPWTWSCSGLNGGIAASCSATKNTPPAPPPPGPAVNGLCGAANGVAMVVQPMDNLCSTGTATSVSGQGPWNWSCIGENSGMTVSCTAPLQPPSPISGVCGIANGVPTLTTPRSGLCSAGISSAVSGRGPWTWSCSGVNGGSAVGCVAPLAGGEVGSLPSMTTQSSEEEAPAPKAAPSSVVLKKGLVTPKLPAGSLPALSTGNLPPPPSGTGMTALGDEPQLPEDTEGVAPPPVRDMIQPSPALRSDESGNVLPGNHFVLDADVSSIPFPHGTDNYDASVLPKLNKLADQLIQNSGVRITLTAYADATGMTPREARRLSLGRALTLRDFLTTKGISSARIDVRALGANNTTGDADRVDVKAN